MLCIQSGCEIGNARIPTGYCNLIFCRYEKSLLATTFQLVWWPIWAICDGNNDNQNLSCMHKVVNIKIITYRKTSNIRRTLVSNIIVDYSDVVGASPVGAAPTTSSFSTKHLASRDSAKIATGQYRNLLSVIRTGSSAYDWLSFHISLGCTYKRI